MSPDFSPDFAATVPSKLFAEEERGGALRREENRDVDDDASDSGSNSDFESWGPELFGRREVAAQQAALLETSRQRAQRRSETMTLLLVKLEKELAL